MPYVGTDLCPRTSLQSRHHLPNSTKSGQSAKLCNMVLTINTMSTMGTGAPGRVGKTQPRNPRSYHHLPMLRTETQDRSGRGLSASDEPTEGALTAFPRHDGREGGVCFETVDLPVLIDIVTAERNALSRLPGSSRPKGPIVGAIHRYLLS